MGFEKVENEAKSYILSWVPGELFKGPREHCADEP